MADFLIWLTWTIALAAVAITLAYRRSDLPTATLILGFALVVYSLFGVGWLAWKLILWVLLAGLVVLNSLNFRRERITLPLLHFYRSVVPTLSDTEREALEAGTVGWDGELFSGAPDWARLMALPAPRLTAEEQAFLDGPTEELCRMADDWQITHELADMPPKVWAFIKQHRFFAMIIPKRYGGLEFSPIAVAAVLAKLSSRSAVVSSTVGVPNSLGPAELLLHYGTEEQREKYLPRLATAEEIPCFALTGPRVGSDAASLPDTGVVCKGMWQGQEIIGIRLNWDKRYITLAPIATVLGLAFKLFDPDHLIGTETERGITAALVPVRTPGVEIGRRHLPLNIPFQNGPTRGRDVFVPLDAIIGGPERAGQGWKMLVEQLSAGRGITLPSSAMGGSKAVVYASGAYTRLRKQFNVPVCEFEGVGEALARIAGYTYIINAGMTVTSTMIARGEKPAVPSAVLKYHCTELARKVCDDAMDVHGGKGIMLGPSNYLGRGYQGVPIAITVEGANILTRSLIIFGQGAIRCHPFVLKEMEAAKDPDFNRGLRDFDRYLFAHIGYAISNAARSFVLALTNAEVSSTPMDGPTARFFQHVNRYSAAFALAADVAMLVLGGQLKRRETLSARLGDVFSSIYLASMVLKHFDNQGRQDGDLPLVEWACRTLLYQAQEQLHGFLRNFPNRIVAAMLRVCIFPRGRMYSAPPDDLGREIVALITRPTETRARLCDGIYATRQPDSPLGQLQATLEMAERLAPLEEKIRDAIRADVLTAGNVGEVTAQAVERGLITADEARQLREFDTAVLAIISVDDFDPSELRRVAQPATLPFHDTAGAVG
ncbi:MAG: acyl-CoA dehydrogenase [Gammaproteobacteria bacterium]|nr:acyl-CoA dehydrogenase [Gammaproteobacteria bacterium]MDH5275483.1 acyl-CoA dehydrogenase [Gammaproteobacteria bacterium]